MPKEFDKKIDLFLSFLLFQANVFVLRFPKQVMFYIFIPLLMMSKFKDKYKSFVETELEGQCKLFLKHFYLQQRFLIDCGQIISKMFIFGNCFDQRN